MTASLVQKWGCRFLSVLVLGPACLLFDFGVYDAGILLLLNSLTLWMVPVVFPIEAPRRRR